MSVQIGESVAGEEMQAINQGMQAGQAAGNRIPLSGMPPTAGSPRGAAPPVDPLTGRFRACVADLQALADALKQTGDAKQLDLDFQEMAIKVQRMMVERQTRIMNGGSAQQGAGMATNFPNVDGGGVV